MPRSPHGEETLGTITCTVVLEVRDLVDGLASGTKSLRRSLMVWAALVGFLIGSDLAWKLGRAVGFAATGWAIATLVPRIGARRSLANKSEPERTMKYVFSPKGIEITTSTHVSRRDWPTVHHFVEGPTTFGVYLTKSVLQVVPKRALRNDDVAALRAMLATHVMPPKRSRMRRVFVASLWFALFLVIWAFLQFQRPDHPPTQPPPPETHESP
jgi:YcxB-like protein